jgi:hypothetical protein
LFFSHPLTQHCALKRTFSALSTLPPTAHFSIFTSEKRNFLSYLFKSLTDVAKFGDGDGAQVLGEMIECACSGIMACSTCHVVVAVSKIVCICCLIYNIATEEDEEEEEESQLYQIF